MNIEIANRLVKLRKKHGLSQEELADKLGISRQAVSKWERAESSPDTDNLICLAKLYGVSLDELLDCDRDIDDIADEKRRDSEEKKKEGTVYKDKNATVNIEGGRIHVVTEDEEVTVGLDGIYVNTKDEKISLGKNMVVNEGNKSVEKTLTGIYTILVLLAFLILGFTIPSTWAVSWCLFLTIPVFSSIFKAIRRKRLRDFNFVTLVTFVYLSLGMLTTTYPETFNFNWWHPGWVIFIGIVVWYELVKLIQPIKFSPIIIENDDEEDTDEEDEDEE